MPLQAGKIPAELGSKMPLISIMIIKNEITVKAVAISHFDKVFIWFSCFNFP
jgi:hypothetical protein